MTNYGNSKLVCIPPLLWKSLILTILLTVVENGVDGAPKPTVKFEGEANLEKKSGKSLNLTAKITPSGITNPTVKWSLNGSPLDMNANVSSNWNAATSKATLAIRKLDISLNGKIELKIETEGGVASDSVKLQVTGNPPSLLEWFNSQCEYEEKKPPTSAKNAFDVGSIRKHFKEKRNGTFGQVTEVDVKDQFEGQTEPQINRCAAKEMTIQSMYDRDRKKPADQQGAARNVCREMRMFQKFVDPLPSPFIAPHRYSFVDHETVFLVSDYYGGGDFLIFLLSVGQLLEVHAKTFGFQIIHALSALHKMDVIHADLKPENIMMNDEGNLKIIDWGTSDEDDGLPSTVAAGSVPYMSPQLTYVDQGTIRGKVDVWAYGIMWWTMLLQRLPFNGTPQNDVLTLYKTRKLPDEHSPMIIEQITTGKNAGTKQRVAKHEDISLQLRELIVKINNPGTHKTRQTPEEELERLTADQIKNDPYFSDLAQLKPEEVSAPFKPIFDKKSGKWFFIEKTHPDFRIPRFEENESTMKKLCRFIHC
ncbi:protein kinase domain-containing protein [Ditylenchus destructor]|uniref:Protein kinase domain-containing protein n=1 Tax=Ditylenchus destructor TaxID=166010 RepID=A0AAD4QTY9_9BILA|nr:protein kinase domain-containing protein [Ditylenchus destructor]